MYTGDMLSSINVDDILRQEIANHMLVTTVRSSIPWKLINAQAPEAVSLSDTCTRIVDGDRIFVWDRGHVVSCEMYDFT
jgi:hypothetical protein